MKPPIPWLRVFVEGVVIVGSILLAFGIDAWWEGRGEREDARYLLTSLIEEVQTNLVALDSTVSKQNQVLAYMRALIDVHNGSRPLPSPDSMKLLITNGATTYWRTSHHGVAFPVYDAMVSTGAAQLLPTPDLGTRLAKHRTDIEQGQGDEPYAERAFEDVLEVLREHGGWYSVAPDDLLDWMSLQSHGKEPDIGGLVSDPAFAEALFSRVLWEKNITDHYVEQIDALKITLDMLRNEAR